MAKGQYIEGIGRRKTATARVRITPSKEQRVIINEKPIAEYFYAPTLQKNVLATFETKDAGIETYEVSAKVQEIGRAHV